jgi:putative endonuclease
MFSRTYHVYIMSSASRRLYIGVTGNLALRVYEHRTGQFEGFSKKYQMKRLVYAEPTSDVHTAIRREKQIKGWLRARKIELIESINPEWRDLGEDLLGSGEIPPGACHPERSEGSLKSHARHLRDPSLRSG